MSLLSEMNEKATARGIPVAAHMDITWRCNERCVHCYLDHDGKGEMTTDEIKDVLSQLADAGTFFLSISGGEPLMRRDCFEILEYARTLRFNVKLKTNAVMIGPKEAARIRKLGIEQVQISLYSHRPEVHDAITKLPGSLRRTIKGIREPESEWHEGLPYRCSDEVQPRRREGREEAGEGPRRQFCSSTPPSRPCSAAIGRF